MDDKVYQIVTDKIVELLNAGTVPWRKPWADLNNPGFAPRNLVSMKPYRGINRFLLGASMYRSPFWMTYKQALELGGHVNKGESSTIVVFWKVDTFKVEPKADDPDDDGKRKRVILRYYRVFNSEQCELPEKVLAKIEKHIGEAKRADNFDPIACAEEIVDGYKGKPEIQNGPSACYNPRLDRIMVPAPERFDPPCSYYATLFHEMGHSTGHKDRLGRKGVMEAIVFGSNDYSREELVAEMTCAFLCAEAGIAMATIENSAAYIASWLKVLKADPKAVVIAAAQAQKASDFILDRKAAQPEAENAAEAA